MARIENIVRPPEELKQHLEEGELDPNTMEMSLIMGNLGPETLLEAVAKIENLRLRVIEHLQKGDEAPLSVSVLLLTANEFTDTERIALFLNINRRLLEVIRLISLAEYSQNVSHIRKIFYEMLDPTSKKTGPTPGLPEFGKINPFNSILEVGRLVAMIRGDIGNGDIAELVSIIARFVFTYMSSLSGEQRTEYLNGTSIESIQDMMFARLNHMHPRTFAFAQSSVLQLSLIGVN